MTPIRFLLTTLIVCSAVPTLLAQGSTAPYETTPVVPAFEVIRSGQTPPGSGGAEADVNVPAESLAPVEVRGVPSVPTQPSRLANDVIAASRSAFLRGLIDLPSYAMHLEVARSLQLRSAAAGADRDLAARALDREILLLAEATTRLDEFNQPASRGWASDVELAGLLLKRSQYHRRAMFDETGIGNEDAARDIQNTARVYFTRRLADYRVGWASPVQVIQAAKYAYEQPADTLEALDSRPFRFQVTEEFEREVTQSLLSDGLGGAVVDVSPWQTAGTGKTPRQVLEILRDANTELSEQSREENESVVTRQSQLLNDQFVRFETGTASLSDMQTTWWLQQSLSLDDKGTLNVSNIETRQLMSIGQRAATLQDVRGRVTADLLVQEAMVHLTKPSSSGAKDGQ